MKVGDRVWVEVSRDKERLGTIKKVDPYDIIYPYNVLLDGSPNDSQWYSDCHMRTATIDLDTTRIHLQENAAVKSDHSKPDMSLIPRAAKVGIALAMMDGEKKYGRYNYLEGMDWSRLIGAADRHLSAFNDGEDDASDSKLNHLYHAAANLCMLIEYHEKGIGNDNRNKKNT